LLGRDWHHADPRRHEPVPEFFGPIHVEHNVIAAVCHDPRARPVSLCDVADLDIELSILSSLEPIAFDDEASALPVAFFDVYVRNTSPAPARLDLALFMPNFLGWRKGY
jgi:hypothetical protein